MADLKVLSEADVKILQEVIANAKRGRLNSLPSPQPDLDLSSAAPETYIAYGSVPGLTTGVGTAPATPGTATCAVYQVINDELQAVEGLQLTVYNLAEESISGYFSIHRSKFGQWLAIAGTCCIALCCNLRVGVSDSVVACECSVNVPLYKFGIQGGYSNVAQSVGGSFPLARNDSILAEDGIGFDGSLIRSIAFQMTNGPGGLPDVPDSYTAFGDATYGEPVTILKWGLDFNLQRQRDLEVLTPNALDTVTTELGSTGAPIVLYRGVQLYDHEVNDSVGAFFQSHAFISDDPTNHAGPVKSLRYFTKTDDSRMILYPYFTDYTQPSPNQAFYDDFAVFELEINIDEDATATLGVPPATQPVIWSSYPDIEQTEDLYKELGDGGWLGFLQPECQRVPLEFTGTAETGSPINPDSVTVRGLSPSGNRSKAWTTLVILGQTYTCKWIAGYDGEDLADVLAEGPMIQSQQMMYRYGEGSTTDQEYREPLLSGGAQIQGATPTTIPMSKWHPVQAWVGTKADAPSPTGTAGTGTGTGDNAWILPNGIDWRTVCLTVGQAVDMPCISNFDDYWTAVTYCVNPDSITGLCCETSGTA